VAGVGSALLALFTVACPEPGDLQNPGNYPAPVAVAGQAATGGSAATTAGTGGGDTAGPGCESACMATIINTPSTGCKACHGASVKLAGTLDLETAGYGARLRDQAAEHAGVTPGAACPSGDKMIDSANPSESWLLKKVTNMQGDCGTVMPLGGALPAADQECFTTFVNCVAGGAAPPSISTSSDGSSGAGGN